MDYYDDYDYMLATDDDDYDAYPLPSTNADHTLIEIQSCVQASTTQIVSYLLALLLTNLVYQVLWRLCMKRAWLQHTASMLCGFALLYFATGQDFLIVLFLALLLYALMLLLECVRFKNIGLMVAVLTIVSHIVYEVLWDQPEAWQRIRGIQMVANMKIISLAFDYEAYLRSTESKTNDDESSRAKRQSKHIAIASLPSIIPYLGYIFCPGTCVLGPWISCAEYMRSHQNATKPIRSLICVAIINTLLAVILLCLSNCVVPAMCSEHAWKWLRMYRDALVVRCSHYFICFLSQATLAASGIACPVAPKSQQSSRLENLLGRRRVTKPLHIELPRSLSDAVRTWNIPMHEWLKHYVFNAMHKRFKRNYLVAIFSTYLVSALLHGMHLRIYIVLLSLASFAYVEVLLRRKLACVFDACVVAHACERPCPFRHCPSHGWRSTGAIATAMVNCCFSLLAILHLAYLGIMMATDANGDGHENILHSESHQYLTKWLNLNYMSHWIALASYLFYLVV